MTPPNAATPPSRLPTRRALGPLYVASLAIVLLVAAAAVMGLADSARVYPTDELRQAFLANDIVELAVGLPILLGSMWLARRGKLIGLLFWPGATLYVLYNHIAYVRALPLGGALLLHIALVSLSAYTTIGLVAGIDGAAVQERLRGRVRERLAAGVLVGL